VATKLYFRNLNAADSVAGTLPTSERSAATANATSGAIALQKKLELVKGSGTSVRSLASVASAASQKMVFGIWITDPLASAQSLDALGGVDFAFAAFETNANSNFAVNSFNIYVWRPSTGAVVGYILDFIGGGSVLPVSEAGVGQYKVCVGSVASAGPAVAALAGDVIVVEVWCMKTQSSATAYNDQILFDGSTERTVDGTVVSGTTENASYIILPNDIAFATSIESGDGAAAASLVTSGVGGRVLSAAGSAAMVLSTSGASVNFQSGAGAATCVLSASGVGRGTTPAQGLATAALSALGVWDESSVVSAGAGAAEMALSGEAFGTQYFPHIFMPEAPAGDGWTKQGALV
jgi:hypothetical protein